MIRCGKNMSMHYAGYGESASLIGHKPSKSFHRIFTTPLLFIALLCTFLVPSNAGQKTAEKEPSPESDDQPLLPMSASNDDVETPLDNKA